MERTGGNPAVLRAHHRQTRGRVAAARGPVEAYDRAIRAVAEAPASPEVTLVVPSIAPVLEQVLDRIGIHDHQIAAYADALEWADATVPGFESFDDTTRAALLLALLSAILDGSGDLASVGLEVAADAIGHHAAQQVAALIADGEADLVAWESLASTLEQIASDPRTSVAFLTALGAERLAAVPVAIEAAWLAESGGIPGEHDQRAWDVLGGISAVFAAGSWTIAPRGGLPSAFVDELLAVPLDRTDVDDPNLGDIGLLFSAGGFADQALLPLADLAEAELEGFAKFGRLSAFGTPWGIHAAPANTILPALGESPVAAAQGPRVAAQLLAMGAIDEDLVGHTMIQVTLRSARDGYAETLESELIRLGLQDDGITLWRQGIDHITDELSLIGAAPSTLQDLHRESMQAERTMRLSADRQARLDAYDFVEQSPRNLARAATSPVVVATRWLPAVGVGTSLIGHLRDGTPLFESAVRTGFTAGGAAAGTKGAAWLGAPLLAMGPWGWAGYGGVLLLGGGAGALGGDVVGDALFDADPDRHLWADTVGGQLPASPLATTPGPSEP